LVNIKINDPLRYTNAFTYPSFHILCWFTRVHFSISEGLSDVDKTFRVLFLASCSITKLYGSKAMQTSVVCVIKNSVLFDVTPRSLISEFRRFGGYCCQNISSIFSRRKQPLLRKLVYLLPDITVSHSGAQSS